MCLTAVAVKWSMFDEIIANHSSNSTAKVAGSVISLLAQWKSWKRMQLKMIKSNKRNTFDDQQEMYANVKCEGNKERNIFIWALASVNSSKKAKCCNECTACQRKTSSSHWSPVRQVRTWFKPDAPSLAADPVQHYDAILKAVTESETRQARFLLQAHSSQDATGFTVCPSIKKNWQLWQDQKWCTIIFRNLHSFYKIKTSISQITKINLTIK